ncbi:hypothetical protein [Streptomyces sp. NPDC046759]|uniref:hypothetical protein n=1 Tax=Streptomyces sp. NPDC046759 TaxID=3155019 RepID=UPI0033D486C9
MLRHVSEYDPAIQTWNTFIGAFDVASIHTLQTLFDAARTFGSDVQLEPAPVPAT